VALAFSVTVHLVRDCISCGAALHLVSLCIQCETSFSVALAFRVALTFSVALAFRVALPCIWCHCAFSARLHFVWRLHLVSLCI
jgi:hypothetical protein